MRRLFIIVLLAFAAHSAPAALRAESGTGLPTRDAAIAAPTLFTRDQLLAAVTRDLTAHFNLDGELQLELLRAWTAPARPAAVWDLTVVEYPTTPATSMLIRIRLLADGKPAASAADSALLVRASLWRDAWATRQPLTVGTTFDPAALEARRVDLFRERDVLPTSAGDRTFIVARAVSAGRILTWRDIARRPLVKKGAVVEVSAASGLLIVTMKALALENGAQGETVTVRNPESQKNFAAVVVDENRVQVRF